MNLEKESVLNLDECKEAVRNYLQSDNFEIREYKVEPFSNSVNGFLSDHLRITVIFVTEGVKNTKTFFGKCFPYRYELQSQYATSTGVFLKEIFTYNVLFSEFQKCLGFNLDFAPVCYYHKDDFILFENLDEKQFVVHAAPNALPLDHLEMCLKLLAKFHAGSIAYQESKSKELNRKYCLTEDYQKYVQEPLFQLDENFLGYKWFQARFSALIAMVDLVPFSDIAANDLKNKLKEVGEKSFEILKPKSEFYNVICHGDVWAKNFLFRYEGVTLIDAKLIDYQLERYCPPAHDVLQLIFLGMSSARRQRHLHHLLRFYHGCLGDELKKGAINIDRIISYSEFETSVHYLLPQIKLLTNFYCGFQGATQEFYKTLTTNQENFKKFVFGDGAPFVTELFKTDAMYKKLLVDTIVELKILVTHDLISLEDCYKILEKKLEGADYTFSDYSMERVTDISGFLGDHYRLKILTEEGHVLNLFAKCAPKSLTRFNLAVGANVFVKEFFVLETLFPMMKQAGVTDINECIVSHHLIRVNDVIVFDDLTFSGFRSCSQRVPFTFDELQVVVRKLAIYHASNIVVEEKLSLLTKGTFKLSSFKKELEESFFSANSENHSALSIKLAVDTVPFQIELFSELDFPDDFLLKVHKAYDYCYELVQPSNTYRNVVCHGDLWADNIMIRYDDEQAVDCRIIDYQILRYCPPAHDLLTLLYLTTTRAVRSDCMQALIDYYFNIFANVLKRHGCDVPSIYSYEHFLASCHDFTPQAVCQTVIFYHFTMTDPELMRDYIKDEELTHKIFLEDRKDFIRDMCERDPIYRMRMKESLEDLKEMCLKYFKI